MVSIRKYLDAPWPVNWPGPAPHTDGLADLVCHMINGVEEHILPPDDDLHNVLRSIRSRVSDGCPEELLRESADAFSDVLKTYRERMAKLARDQSHDLYRILSSLNEALLLLAEGSTRTVGRLKQLEASLERATSINDIAALKTKLGEILALIREEVRQERTESHRERSTLERQMNQVRRGAHWMKCDLPGREDATAMIERLAQSAISDGKPSCVIVFVLGRIREIIRRYGEAAANDLVADLVHRRISFPDSDAVAFRWSPEAVAICLRWNEGVEQLSSLIETQIDTQFEHRLILGSRVAVLRVGLHWVVLPVSGQPESVIDQIDRFAGGNA